MTAAIRALLQQTGGRCPFPDTDPDVWIAPDGRVGRVVMVDTADDDVDGVPQFAFVPLVLQ